MRFRFKKLTVSFLAISCVAGVASAEPTLEYNRDIRPILSENCFACHGPDSGARKAKLRLDRFEDAIAPRKDGKPAIAPGKPDGSALVYRIFATDEEDIMPPVTTHKVLKPEQKEKLKRWIAEGARYQPHWAYMKIVRPALPQLKNSKAPRNPIDAFILHALGSKNIKPSSEADKRVQLRRLSLDLIGLPPTHEELNAYLHDNSSKAYERQVDRLLASPHFGERMALTWLDVNPPHFPARAKRIIHLCMAGGPSHLESFDYKPKLKELDGKPFPESLTKGQQIAQLQLTELKARGPAFEFKKYGQSGQEISSIFPHIAGMADDLCIVRSMHTEQINHDPAHAFMNSGSIIKGRPSMGSWLLYGLGAETEELPGFVVLTSAGKNGLQPVSARQWSSGFLPSRFQGILFQSKGDAVHYVGNPEGVCQSTQRQVVEEINRLNGILAEERIDPEIQTRISQYEMAFRMQTSVPELTNLEAEPKHILELYGVKEPGDGSFASNCLMARRLAERGVRFIQLYHRAWDHHGNLAKDMPVSAQETDRACAALIKDLKQRGLLDETLILWGGEFGRTPMGQGSGRDHHILAFSVWMAGGGIKAGTTWGETDELGYKYVDNDQAMHVHDLHATMLHLCGVDHKRLTYRAQGRDFRLTDVSGKVARGILA